MIFEDAFVVNAPAAQVWTFLRNPLQVARCIPGVERIEVVDDQHYHVVVGAKVSFLDVSFAMKVSLREVQEPVRITSVAEGLDDRLKERLRLVAELNLSARGPRETEVAYKIEMTLLGRLGSIGLHVVRAKAKQMAAQFADAVRRELETGVSSTV